jgi:hypothetical protein
MDILNFLILRKLLFWKGYRAILVCLPIDDFMGSVEPSLPQRNHELALKP